AVLSILGVVEHIGYSRQGQVLDLRALHQLQIHLVTLQDKLTAMQERAVAQLHVQVFIAGLRLVRGKNQIDYLSHGDRSVAGNDQLFFVDAFQIALDRLARERAHFNRFRLSSPRAAHYKKSKDDEGEQTKSWHVQFIEETKQMGCGRYR